MTSAEAHEQFPRQERIDLAYKVVECGLYLLGTSWLRNLKSKKIQRMSKRGCPRRFVLEASTEEELEVWGMEPDNFKVGILLTEIAVAQHVLSIVTTSSDLRAEVELDLVITVLRRHSGSTTRALLAAHVVNRVDQNIGQRYSKAVEFCLQQAKRTRKPQWSTFGKSSSSMNSREVQVQSGH